MNVLLFMASPGNALGGMEKHFYELANGLADKGLNVTCLAAPEHLARLHPAITRLSYRAKGSRHSPRALLALVKHLRGQRFDIVHAQGSKAASLVQLLTPWFKNTAFLATIHSFKTRYPKAKRFSFIITVSKVLAQDIGQENVRAVYNGIHLQPPSGDIKNLPTHTLKSPVWLAVGRLVPAKGFDLLIEAFQHVPGSLLIAGDGPEKNKLSQQISRLGLSKKVSLLGHRDDIPDLMQKADAVVISSRREGFSYVFAEALLNRKPVVATDVPIANEFLPWEFIVTQPAQPEHFAKHLMVDLSEAQKLQQSAQTRATTELTLESMVENTLSVYQEVRGGGCGPYGTILS